MFPIIIAVFFVGLIFLCRTFYKKNKISNLKYNILKIILIIMILECTVFNINSYRLKFSNYENKNIGNENYILENLHYDEKNNFYIMQDNWACIKIDDLNTRVGTIYVDCISDNEKLDYSILYTDDTSSEYRTLNSKTLVNSLEKSKYTTCYLSGKSKSIGIKIYAPTGTVLRLNSIEVNKDVPFYFNMFRVISFSFFIICLYSFKNNNLLNNSFKENKVFAIQVMFFIIIFFVLINSSISLYTVIYQEDIYCKNFTEALINGQLYLENEPSENILEMENPYDATIRVREKYNWDVAFFNGKFYIYFGILPQILIFIPYMLINKTFLPSGLAVVMFSIMAIIGLGLIVLEILIKWFKEIPIKLWIYAQIITLSGCTIFNLIGRPDFYEVAISSALCFSIFGILFVLKFFVNESKKYRNLFWGCSFLALAVSCRPTAILVSLIVAWPILKLFIKNIKERRNIVKFILAVVIPYSIVGILLMIYNYMRFQNPFEFGAKYQLTVNDMTHLKYRLFTIPTGIYMALLKIPHFISRFPFISWDSESLSFFGFFYTENNFGGLFMLVPTCFGLFLLPKLKGKFKDKELKYVCLSFFIAGMLICLISITQAGVIQRYLADYAWLLIISSIIVIFLLYKNLKSAESKKIVVKIIEICCIFTFFVNLFSGGFVGEYNYMKEYNPECFYKLEYTICFWE